MFGVFFAVTQMSASSRSIVIEAFFEHPQEDPHLDDDQHDRERDPRDGRQEPCLVVQQDLGRQVNHRTTVPHTSFNHSAPLLCTRISRHSPTP